MVSWSEKLNSWQEAWKRVMKQYGEYHWVHTLPNVAFVLIGLIRGELDFSKKYI